MASPHNKGECTLPSPRTGLPLFAVLFAAAVALSAGLVYAGRALGRSAGATGLGIATLLHWLHRFVLLAKRSLDLWWKPRFSLGAAALPAVAGFVLLAARAVEPVAVPDDHLPSPDPAPPAIHARFICSLANDDAKRALVQGADGGLSVVAAGRSYWLFGDTLFLPQSGKQIEQNSIAWSDERDADGCPHLTYHVRDGIAAPFLPKDGSLTSWPSGAIANADGTIDFYTVYVYGSGPYAYWIGEVGLARVDPRTMQVEILARRLWDANSGFRSQAIAAQPVEMAPDGLLRVVVQALNGEKLLARVARERIHIAAAYEYWDGAGWSADPAAAAPLWPLPQATSAVEKLAMFENSAHIVWNAHLGKYVALTNAGHAAVGARTADRLEGPWSELEPWLDCLSVAQEAVPVCYSTLQHPQFATDGGLTLFITFTRAATYDVVAFELTLGTPIHEYRSPGGDIAYATTASPGGGWVDQGVAFHASQSPLPGFTPVYRWQRGDDTLYAVDTAADGFVRAATAFYAPASAAVEGSLTKYRPVYDWRNGATQVLSTLESGLEQYGFSREAVAFYAP